MAEIGAQLPVPQPPRSGKCCPHSSHWRPGPAQLRSHGKNDEPLKMKPTSIFDRNHASTVPLVNEHYDRFAGVKKRERNSRSPNTRPISLNEKNGISAMAKMIII